MFNKNLTRKIEKLQTQIDLLKHDLDHQRGIQRRYRDATDRYLSQMESRMRQTDLEYSTTTKLLSYKLGALLRWMGVKIEYVKRPANEEYEVVEMGVPGESAWDRRQKHFDSTKKGGK